MRIIANDTTLAVLTFVDFTNFRANFFTKWGKDVFQHVNIDVLTNLQRACIQAKIEDFEIKNNVKWLKD